MPDVVNKLGGFCHTLRHDGIDYGDYLEQMTFLCRRKPQLKQHIESHLDRFSGLTPREENPS